MPPKTAKTAVISRDCKLGNDVSIGEGAILNPGVEVGDGVVVQPYCIIGDPEESRRQRRITRIGPGCLIRSHSVIYGGCDLGERVSVGHRAFIREDTIICKGVSVGTDADIEGHVRIGEFTRIHSDVHLCSFTRIGNYVWIFPRVMLVNDPTPPSDKIDAPVIDDFAVVGACTLLFPGTRIGRNAVIGAGSSVRGEVPEGILAAGVPAVAIGPARLILDAEGRPCYPWKDRLRTPYGFPWEAGV